MVTAAEPKHPAATADRQAPLEICLPKEWVLTDAAFDELIDLNPELRFEVDEMGRLIVMGSGGLFSSMRAARIIGQLYVWIQAGGGGEVSGESGYFSIEGFGRRAPDAAWISPERIASIAPGDEGPGRMCPDFIVEVVSQSDRRSQQEAKMRAWIEHGVRLGWLIDPFRGLADIYREDGSHEQLARPATLSGEDVLDGLTIDLSAVWRAE